MRDVSLQEYWRGKEQRMGRNNGAARVTGFMNFKEEVECGVQGLGIWRAEIS